MSWRQPTAGIPALTNTASPSPLRHQAFLACLSPFFLNAIRTCSHFFSTRDKLSSAGWRMECAAKVVGRIRPGSVCDRVSLPCFLHSTDTLANTTQLRFTGDCKTTLKWRTLKYSLSTFLISQINKTKYTEVGLSTVLTPQINKT